MNKDKPVLLIVTQDLPTKLFIRHNLEEKYHILEKTTFEETLQAVESTKIDIVIVDDKIQNAIDLCFQMKKRKRLFTTPIILITGSLKKAYKEKAVKAGVFDCLLTPLKDEELLSLIKRCEDEKNKINKVSSISFKIKKM
ncbi:MAG: hypothetical protein ACD_20C00070G0001 [uncultured bacterium]|nr:MAG: hypothetical protein ACD_20C00070G0001 [uncultured bacterium]